ncbi:MAG TPA: hypothetical protein VM536_10805 [Chloroflexia bacterium]|nr:hypothetical protein [Chloroflexia bacterium]
MFEQGTRIISESLARAVDRRTFMKRASQAAFAGVLTLVAGHGVAGRAAAAAGGTKPPVLAPVCSPPGPYCNYEGGYPSQPDSCRGAHCWQHLVGGVVRQCRVYYTYYQSGCWTTASGGGYWTCCDCECLNASGQRVSTCGCAQFSTTPAPLPSGSGA